MTTIALIDYGSGNLPSAQKALEVAARAFSPSPRVLVTADPDDVARADRLVLPGVGAFATCMQSLKAINGLLEAMACAARTRGAPFLGICVGMQLLATRGLEFGESAGLGWIEGVTRRLSQAGRVKIPHMGWNTLCGALGPVFSGLDGADMYFTHSFAFLPSLEADVAAWTCHGERFAAAVTHENLVGVQFHPEKSQAAGARMLANFLAWRP